MDENAPKPAPKVINLFSREALEGAEQRELLGPTPPETSAALDPTKPVIDTRSIETLNAVLEGVLKGELSGVTVIATNKEGLGRFFIAIQPGKNTQTDAVRYLGLNVIMQGVLKDMALGEFESDE